MIITEIKNLARYQALSADLQVACEFLMQADLSKFEPGPFEIAGTNVSGNCFDYEADGRLGELFEGHEAYIDIHLTTQNCERMALTTKASAVVKTPYDKAKDIAFYTGQVEQVVKLFPGNCLITFPEDLHQPKVRYDEKNVRKVVLKVKC
ncbi:YhcH/YjgK/YiaL family protein [Ligilactobacillus animalis]|nr:YhcH/YjgK/YiaL family protein [Ligilactobacillus animalis]